MRGQHEVCNGCGVSTGLQAGRLGGQLGKGESQVIPGRGSWTVFEIVSPSEVSVGPESSHMGPSVFLH